MAKDQDPERLRRLYPGTELAVAARRRSRGDRGLETVAWTQLSRGRPPADVDRGWPGPPRGRTRWEPSATTAAAVQWDRRRPGAAAALRGCARPGQGDHPVRPAGHRRLAAACHPLPLRHTATNAGRPA